MVENEIKLLFSEILTINSIKINKNLSKGSFQEQEISKEKKVE